MSVAVGTSRSEAAGLLALQEVHAEPGIPQAELNARLREATGLAASTVRRVLQRLERDGHLVGSLDEGHKAYSPARQPGVVSEGTGFQLLALLGTVLTAAAGAAFFLAPARHQALPHESSAPATPKPAPHRHAHPRPKAPAASLAAAKHLPITSLSATSVPGIAGKTGQRLGDRGFQVIAVGNAPAPAKRSAVLYTRGAKAAARALAGHLHIKSIRAVDPDSGNVAPSARLFVVLGQDRSH